jgi:hypothetical protein
LSGIPAEYFGVFRPVDLSDQPSFEATLEHALAVDVDHDATWRGAERLAARVASASVGARLLEQMQAWRTSARVGARIDGPRRTT